MYSISFCTAIRNRLHHLRQTLPQNIADNSGFAELEFVVLDYNSNDGLEEWIHTEMAQHLQTGRLVYQRTDEPEYFHRSKSRNMAFAASSGELVCNVDADNFIGENFAEYIDEKFTSENGIFLTAFSQKKANKSDFLGRICAKRSDFDRVGGYNENMDGYGFEDYELIARLNDLGLKQEVIEGDHFFKAITHGDEERISEEWAYQSLKALYLSLITPGTTSLLFLFKDGTYGKGTLIDQTTLHAEDVTRVFQPRDYRYEFTLEEPAWVNGIWEQAGEVITLKGIGSTEVFHIIGDNELGVGDKLYHKTTDEKLITNLVMFYTQFTNRNFLKHDAPFERPAVNGQAVKENDHRIVPISIFYPKENWHLLLTELLRPLTIELLKQNPQVFNTIHLSKNRGENIGVTWFLPATNAATMLTGIDGKIKQYLNANNAVAEPATADTHSTFKNFASGTVAYGLYPFPFFTVKHLNFHEVTDLSRHITTAINDALTNDVIDNESAFTLAFYLHVLMVNAFSLSVDSLEFENISDTETFQGNEFENALADNEQLFDEIMSDLGNDTFLHEPDNRWMLNWMEACREIASKKQVKFMPEADVHGLVNDISVIILEHLGLTTALQGTIITFISKTINKPAN